jgi:hypothetical protein
MENPRSLLSILGLTNLGRTLLGEKGTKSLVGLRWTWAQFWTVNKESREATANRVVVTNVEPRHKSQPAASPSSHLNSSTLSYHQRAARTWSSIPLFQRHFGITLPSKENHRSWPHTLRGGLTSPTTSHSSGKDSYTWDCSESHTSAQLKPRSPLHQVHQLEAKHPRPLCTSLQHGPSAPPQLQRTRQHHQPTITTAIGRDRSPDHYVKTSNRSHNICNGPLTPVTSTHICNGCCLASVTYKRARTTPGLASTPPVTNVDFW